ncbi:MAG: alpha/beta hydrolase [Gammaproteobacteria bacterium]|nr:alpha/beta hydrolase [Gammaproteobacteria bacterium]MDH5309447.1 alpha/beta hydrolase [Gammaproteobacteria bacterium]
MNDVTTPAGIMTAADLARFPSPPADHVIPYGDDPLQFGELRLPDGDGPFPLIVLVHGGVWLAEYDLAHVRKLAQGFATAGIATWTIEYRRVGNPGGGWPGTFEDVAAAGDFVVELARRFPLDPGRVITAGHSAGGHLALWFADRPGEMRQRDSIRPRGVLALAPAPDLEYLQATGAYDRVVDRLMGGSPREFPERYAAGSGMRRIPVSTPQVVIVGRYDTFWRPIGLRYVEAALAAGAPLELIDAPESGHFELIDPDASDWRLVLDAARRLLGVA